MNKTAVICPITATLDVLGGKWKVFILMQLKQREVLRFGELKKLIPDVTQKMLAQQLKELEDAGLVHRHVYPVIPPKVEYRLTAHGQTLKPVLEQLHLWGVRHRDFLNLPAARNCEEVDAGLRAAVA
jgi:DNA-binding HxlR family transcriptional regulator